MSQPASTTGSSLLPIAIRPAVREDAEGIARFFLESAEHHAEMQLEGLLLLSRSSVARSPDL